MKSEKITFTNKEGLELSAKLDFPVDSKPRAYAIFAHCFTCNKNLNAVRNISRELTNNGIAVFRFDFTGLGESEGDFADSNFSSNVSDLVSAGQFLADNYAAPQLLVGHSLGGSAVLLAAKQMEYIKTVATIGAPAEPVHVKKQFEGSADKIKSDGSATVDIGGRPFEVKQQFLDDLEQTNLKEHLRDLNKALLIAHSPGDTIVGVENAAKIYVAAMHPKSFLSLDGADHLLSNKADSIYVGKMIASWAERYLDIEKEEELNSTSRVVVRTGEGYFTQGKAGKHSIVIDEPESVGGTDLGPTPYDYLVAGLGSCTSITVRMYANRKKWRLEAIKVHLEHEKVHQQDSDAVEKSTGKIDRITREIELIGDLTDEQRTRLMAIADRCPVHRTLTEGIIKVETTLKQ